MLRWYARPLLVRRLRVSDVYSSKPNPAKNRTSLQRLTTNDDDAIGPGTSNEGKVGSGKSQAMFMSTYYDCMR